MKEWELQKSLYELLEINNYRVYSDKQRPSTQWYPKTFQGDKCRPDLIFFHNGLRYFNPHNKIEEELPNPIGIELKTKGGISNSIIGAIEDQLKEKYTKTTYNIPERNWIGKIPLLAFANETSIIHGTIFDPLNEPWSTCTLDKTTFSKIKEKQITVNITAKLIIERLLWRLNMCLIITQFENKYNNGLLVETEKWLTISYKNNPFIRICRC